MAIELLVGRKQPPYITEVDNRVEPYLLTLDASIREEHLYKNKITSYPTEDGSTITDHIKPEPEELTLEGFVSGSPINFEESENAEVRTPIDSQARIVNAYEALLKISGLSFINTETNRTTKISNPILVDIFTGLRIFTNMGMVDLSIPRDKSTGAALRFTARFKRVYKVESATAKIRNISEVKDGAVNAKDQAASEEDGGKKNKKEADEADKSWYRKLMEKLTGREYQYEGSS